MDVEHETLSKKRLIAVRTNAAGGATRRMIVVTIRNLTLASKLKQANRVEQPPLPLLGELYPPHLLPGVDHECMGSRSLHLVLNQGAVSQRLDHVVRIDLSTGGRLARVL